MFKQLAKIYKVWRLSNLTPKHVKYEKDKSLIRVTKATVSSVQTTLRAKNPSMWCDYLETRLSWRTTSLKPLLLLCGIQQLVLTSSSARLPSVKFLCGWTRLFSRLVKWKLFR